ncbi:GNAT family N-acetyltransferase [Streptomyces iconiensis]|uniref:GNAT family protein n=1 Tax=Streptomyces iconiensis TaxID=1384038 RepID=A0ABT7A5G5_9ACTN|nr:GNAT family protein [Streptomyces iconiensis]MDJ1136570.1 GNAT family protein [Streptomyces iconiensis]
MQLRALEPCDAESLWRWNNDPDVMRWMDTYYVQSLAGVRRRLEERARNTYGDTLYGIETREGGALIGLVRLRDAEPETGCAELDLYIGEKDHCYATDALRTMCRYGFDTLRLHKISLTVVTENHAAHHLYQKAGFVEEGRLRQVFRRDGQWYDMFTMGLLEGELRPA